MLKKIILLHLFVFIFSCDDGDILVTSFEFDDVPLQICEAADENTFVFFKINTQFNDAISFNFQSPLFNEREETEEPIVIDLKESTNALVYRQFNTKIEPSYYCNNVPDTDIVVTDEFISTEGTASITVENVLEDDNDNVPTFDDDPAVDPIEIEDLNGDGDETNDDTDNDGIPNFKDQDDDNDNIPTTAELSNTIAGDESYLDTDEDGIPNYRDADDDNDGILTINEDFDQNGNPRDDDYDGDGIPNYLDTDDDNDGILTIDEDANNDGNPANDDTDGDGIFDFLDTDSEKDEIIEVKIIRKNSESP